VGACGQCSLNYLASKLVDHACILCQNHLNKEWDAAAHVNRWHPIRVYVKGFSALTVISTG
jgi:hypothetical protein